LGRFTDAQRGQPERYSYEELVAEFGAAFLCAFAGIQDPGNEALQASYIDGWAQVLKKDVRLLVRAAGAAQRAVDYIRGKVVVDETIAAAA
jgi:antirestriction protein ArdC